MGMATRLNASGTVTLATVNGVNGYGVVRLAPAGEKWEINRLRVQCSTRDAEAECRVYSGFIGDNFVMDGTYSGSSGDTSDTTIFLEDGTPIFVVWTGGDNGATATVTVSGWRSDPEGGFRAVH